MFNTQRHSEFNHIPRRPRRGVMVVETLIAALLIGTAVGILLPGVSAVKRQRLSQRFEVLGMVELNNVADSLRHSVSAPNLSPWFLQRYKSATLTLEELSTSPIVPEASGLKAFRVSIHRPLQKGLPDQRISVVVWMPSKEATP